jgi:hypothetical protein
VGMGIDLVGGGMRKTRDSREWKCQNTEWGSLPLTVLIGSRERQDELNLYLILIITI